MIGIAGERLKRPAVVISVLVASILVCVVGCSGGLSLEERLDAISGTYHDSVLLFEETASFLEPLYLLDLDDKVTFDALRGSLQDCEAAADMAEADLEELGEYDYSGKLEHLGTYIMEYRAEYQACLDESKEVYDYLESILVAIEVFMQARGDMPQFSKMDPKQCLQPLEEMKVACDQAAANLSGIEPPEFAVEYHAYMQELFRLSSGVIDIYIGVARGAGELQDATENPAAISYMQVQPQYQQFVDGLYGRLRIPNIDSFMEDVELEINRLYLGDEG